MQSASSWMLVSTVIGDGESQKIYVFASTVRDHCFHCALSTSPGLLSDYDLNCNDFQLVEETEGMQVTHSQLLTYLCLCSNPNS